MKKILIMVLSFVMVIIIGVCGVVFYALFRPGYGEEFKKSWKCDGQDIVITACSQKFPYQTHIEKITVNGDNYDLVFEGDRFSIGKIKIIKEDGVEIERLSPVIEGDYSKGLFDFTMNIDKVASPEYSPFKGKTLVFRAEK